MIFDPNSSRARSATGVVSYITAEIDALCEAGVLTSPHDVEDLAYAVECFVEKEASTSSVTSDYLLMLTSKALSSIGEDHAARRVFFFGTGLVTPSEWTVSGEEAVWELDLTHMTVAEGASLELVFFTSLHAILDSIAEVWDATEGRGVLGLRHVLSAAADLLGEDSPRRSVRLLSQEIKDGCIAKLDQLAVQRHWRDTPQVMDLDV